VRKVRNSKGYTTLELLIALGILAILAGLGLTWYREYITAQRITSETQRLEIVLKDIQVQAKVKKHSYYVEVGDKNLDVYFTNGTLFKVYRFLVPLEANPDTFYVNNFGLFTTQGYIRVAYNNNKASLDCVSISRLRVCTGKFDPTANKCVCSY
jgi:prepilin-type N-terminal cleavage/methylation domain-containing protein